jgi:hypothetical protein
VAEKQIRAERAGELLAQLRGQSMPSAVRNKPC